MGKNTSGVTLAGLAAVRIGWITALGGCMLVIVTGLLAGSGGGGSSQQFTGFGFADGDATQLLPEFGLLESAAVVGGETQLRAQPMRTAVLQEHGSQRTKEQAPGESQSRDHSQDGSGRQRDDAGGSAPVDTPQSNSRVDKPESNSPQSPSVSQPNIPQAPSAPSVTLETPSQPPSGSGDPAPSQLRVDVSVSAGVETPVSVPDVSVDAANIGVGVELD
jgi:hypothetical protein